MAITTADKHREPNRLGYTVTQFAAAFGVSRPTVYKWIASGKLRSVKVDGLRFISAESADELLNK